MKKGLLISFIAASVLSLAQADTIERVSSSWMDMPEIEEHMADTKEKIEDIKEQEKEYKEEAKEEVKEEIKEEVKEEAKEEYKEAKDESKQNVDIADKKETEYTNTANYMATAQEMIEHQNEYKTAYEENKTAQMQEEIKENKEEAKEYKEEVKEEYKEEYKEQKPISLVDLIDDEQEQVMQSLPEDVREVLHEAEKAMKLYKKEELFKEFNITDVADLQDPQIKEEIQRLVEEAKKEREQEVSQKLIQKRVAEVAGEFIRIGDGQYDWAFVTKSGEVYKLAGVTENGTFKYEKLPGVEGVIDSDGTVSIEPLQITNTIEAQIANKEFNGYAFAKYNDPQENGFDWIVVVDGKVYKLEGYDEAAGSFVYTPATDVTAETQDDEVILLPGQEG